ncbi:MAG: hypothetical protein ACRYG4_04160 [Janthinobacterium lividum]
MADDTRTLVLAIQAETEAARVELNKLAGTLGTTASEVDASLTKIESRFSSLNSSVKSSTGLLAGIVGGFFAGAVAGISEKLVETSKRALEYAGTLNKVAEQVGTTTDFLQKFRYAALQNDVTVDQADKGLSSFNTTVGLAATGNLRAQRTFAALKVDIFNADGTLKPLRENFLATADAIAAIKSPSEQSSRALQIFKEDGNELLPLLRQGAAGFDAYAAAAEQLGIVLGPEQIAHAAQAVQQFTNMKEILSVEFASAIVANADALLALAKGFEKAAEGALKYGAAHPGQVKGAGYAIGGAAIGSLIGPEGGVAGALIGSAYGAYVAGNTPPSAVELKRQAQANIDLAPRGSELQKSYQADYDKAYGAKPVASSSALPVNDRAQRVIDSLSAESQTGGDPRQLAITAKLTTAGVSADSDYGKKIAALAGSVYDNGPGARAAEAAANKADAEQKRADAEALAAKRKLAAGDTDVDRARRAFRSAEADATGTPEARYAVQSASIDDNLSDKQKEIAANGPNGTTKYTKLQADNLTALAAATAAQQHIALDKAEEERKLQDQLALTEADLSNQTDQQNALLALAKTADERRTIELRLLDLQLAEERARENAIIASTKSTDAEVAIAKSRLKSIDNTEGAKRTAVLDNTQGPLAAYSKSVNLTTGQMNEALQNVAVDGLKSLDDGLVGIITQTESVGTAFSKMALGIITDLIKIGIEKEIIGPIANSLFGSFPHFADGGVPPAGQLSLVGERGPEWLVGNGQARVVPMSRAAPGASANDRGPSNVTYLSIDARGSQDPVATEAAAHRAVINAAPALNAGIQANTIRTIKRPMLPGNRS